jgi:hypothetical protein
VPQKPKAAHFIVDSAQFLKKGIPADAARNSADVSGKKYSHQIHINY